MAATFHGVTLGRGEMIHYTVDDRRTLCRRPIRSDVFDRRGIGVATYEEGRTFSPAVTCSCCALRLSPMP